MSELFLWHFRVEGVGNYPRCRSARRKTMSAISTENGIKERIRHLKKYGGYKIVWVKNMGVYENE